MVYGPHVNVPDPRTYADSDSIDYRDMDENIFQAIRFKLQPPMVWAKRQANLAVPTGTNVTIPWDVIFIDTHRMIDTTVDATKIIPNVPGRYKFIFGTYFANTGAITGRKVMWLKKNGGFTRRHERRFSNTNPDCRLGARAVTQFMNGTTDYVQMAVFQEQGTSQNITQVSNTELAAYMYMRWESVT